MWDDEEDVSNNVKNSAFSDTSDSDAASDQGFDDMFGGSTSATKKSSPKVASWSDEEGGDDAAADTKGAKAAWDDDSDDDSDLKEDWDADSDEEAEKRRAAADAASAKQQPGVGAKPKAIVHKKKKMKLILEAKKKASTYQDEEDPDEDPQERKKRIAEQQQKHEAALAEDLFGISSDSDDDDPDFSGDDIDRSANTGDPGFMAADGDFDELGEIGGPKVQMLDLKSVRIRGKEEIDKVATAIVEALKPYRENAPYTELVVGMVKALGDKIEAETIQSAVRLLNGMSNEKQSRNRVMKGRKAPKRAEVPATPKAELAARAKTKQKQVEFWLFSPQYKEDYERMGALVAEGVKIFLRNSHYGALVAELIRSMCAHLEPDEIRKVVSPLNKMANDKLEAAKPKKKASGKATLSGGGGKRDDAMRSYDDTMDNHDY